MYMCLQIEKRRQFPEKRKYMSLGSNGAKFLFKLTAYCGYGIRVKYYV